jgi:SAM-dependent methyltransferase
MATPDDLSEALKRYTFYHVIDLGGGVFTPGVREFMSLQAPVLAEIRRAELQGKRVLDIGCADGLFSFEAERRGGRVLGIDSALSLAATEFLIPWLKSSVEMRALNIYDLHVTPEERFDYVIFAGVLYHLRMPFLALKTIADAMNPGGMLLIETALLLSNHQYPLIHVPAPKDSPYEPTSVTFFNHLALVSTLESMGFENVECRAVISPGAGHPTYESWTAFLAGPDAKLAKAKDIVVGRATYLCRRSAVAVSEGQTMLDNYWYNTRPAFQNWESSARLREAFGFVRREEAISRAFETVKNFGWSKRRP